MVYLDQHGEKSIVHAAQWMIADLRTKMTDMWLEKGMIPVGQLYVSEAKYKTLDNIIGKQASPFSGDHYLVGVDETEHGTVIRQFKTITFLDDPNVCKTNCFTLTSYGYTFILETRDTFDQNTFNQAACVSQIYSKVIDTSWHNYQSTLIPIME